MANESFGWYFYDSPLYPVYRVETSLAISLVHIYIDVNMYRLLFALWSVQGKFKIFIEGYNRNILKIIIDQYYLAANISRK